MPGAEGLGATVLFCGFRVLQDEKDLEADGGDGGRTTGVYLRPLNFKVAETGKLHAYFTTI